MEDGTAKTLGSCNKKKKKKEHKYGRTYDVVRILLCTTLRATKEGVSHDDNINWTFSSFT